MPPAARRSCRWRHRHVGPSFILVAQPGAVVAIDVNDEQAIRSNCDIRVLVPRPPGGDCLGIRRRILMTARRERRLATGSTRKDRIAQIGVLQGRVQHAHSWSG
ncbi:MAG: hypothetical protein L6R00_02785 [Phycisphaerae bacterium]|nr:hypothetical protein [Phycisphaerae bacterium]